MPKIIYTDNAYVYIYTYAYGISTYNIRPFYKVDMSSTNRVYRSPSMDSAPQMASAHKEDKRSLEVAANNL